MNRTLIAIALAAPLALGAVACAGTLTVDGYGATYTERPAIVGTHRWTHHGVAVYEHNGRYYREYNGRWVYYHSRPHDLVEVVVR